MHTDPQKQEPQYPHLHPGTYRYRRANRSMTTIGGRPALVATELSSMNGVYVQCRLPSGEDVFVALKDIYQLFKQELVREQHLQGGRIDGSHE